MQRIRKRNKKSHTKLAHKTVTPAEKTVKEPGAHIASTAYHLALTGFILGSFGFVIPAYILGIIGALYAGNASKAGLNDTRIGAAAILSITGMIVSTAIALFIIFQINNLYDFISGFLPHAGTVIPLTRYIG